MQSIRQKWTEHDHFKIFEKSKAKSINQIMNCKFAAEDRMTDLSSMGLGCINAMECGYEVMQQKLLIKVQEKMDGSRFQSIRKNVSKCKYCSLFVNSLSFFLFVSIGFLYNSRTSGCPSFNSSFSKKQKHFKLVFFFCGL